MSTLRISNSTCYTQANQAISSQCKQLVKIIENAERATLAENEAKFLSSDEAHKGLLSDVENAQAVAQNEKVLISDIGKAVEKVKAEFGGQSQSEKVAYKTEV
jgi:hypothetical protein